ncbi:glycoside hydrolase family 3 C-terminal domain-containing protein [Candidatus Lokiarchaeum ossiferum]|uniref:glycoside hydrolase family 3 C-terminal domain-containing protein n=1 Tax=Candidatus Lokiarchaeum ossiferum TaxID=2951803 RepID=UPI00352F92D8
MDIYLDSNKEIAERVSDLLLRMTIEEKILLLRGKDFWTTNSIERLKIPSFGMTDGPLGVAAHSSFKGKRTRFPGTIGLAATWNKELAYQMGKAMGKETKLAGRHQILGPGVNLIRSPLCGRNFEYLSEDPILSSDLGAELVKGIQSENTASCIKHYITNNSETKRMKISTEISERALQEVYVKNYKRIIEKADPWGLMVCYNKINGTYGAENKYILRDILRDQLHFTGHVVTDWGASRAAVEGAAGCIKAGLNLEMPGLFLAKTLKPKKVMKAINEGKIIETDIDYVVKPLLRTFFRVGLFDHPTPETQKIIDIPEHQAIAQAVAEESIVLLKNDGHILPVNLEKTKKIAIMGPNAKKIFGKYLQGGSSAAVPPRFVTPYDGIAKYIGEKGEIVEKPEDADIVLLILGLDHGSNMLKAMLTKMEGDTEGKDRTKYSLPDAQMQLFYDTIQRNPNTVVILIAGSPIDCAPFLEKSPALLNAWYPGMMGGDALARILFGEISPSGKLPVTFPKKLKDHPAHLSKDRFPGDLKNLKIHFDEGIYIGYRYFDKENVVPQFPFGYGLSYTTFELSNLRLDKAQIITAGTFNVSVDVKNTGSIAGSEVIQIYLADDEASVERPLRELQGFGKIHLVPGETKAVIISLDQSAFEFYSVKDHKFIAESGDFTIYAGTSSRNLPLNIKMQYQA